LACNLSIYDISNLFSNEDKERQPIERLCISLRQFELPLLWKSRIDFVCFSLQEFIFNPHPYCNCHKWFWLSTTKSFPVEIPPYSFHHPPRPTYNISMRKSFLVGYHTDISAIRGHAQNILDWLMNFNIAQQTSPEKVFARFFQPFDDICAVYSW